MAVRSASRSSAVTARSVIGGSLLVVLVSIVTPYSEYRLHSVELFQGQLPLGALATLVVIVLPLQWLLARFFPAWRLRESEILFMFSMGFAGLMVYHIGMMGLFLSMVSSPEYFASPENQYARYLLPYLPAWAIVPNSNSAMTWFYTGLPTGSAIPWRVWVGPLFWWWSFFFAFLVLCGSLTAILRKQWFDHEKIRFPQAEVTLALVEGSGGASGRNTVSGSPPFWVGFALSAGILVWNSVSYFRPIWPRIDFSQMAPWVLNFGPGFGVVDLVPDPFVIGISYLVDVKILFSVWFFFLLGRVQQAVQVKTGYVSGQTDLWTTSDNLSGWQSLGGLFFVVFWFLWMSRAHFKRVLQHVLHPETSQEDDSNEMLSYRMSLILLFACNVYMVLWLIHLGLDWYVALVFFVALVVLVLGITRIVAETGMPLVGSPVTAQGITTRLFGDAALGPSNIAGLAVTYAAFRMVEGYPMPVTMHAARLGDSAGASRRTLFGAVLFGSVAAMVVMSVVTIALAYNGGAFNFGAHHAFHQMYEAYDHMTGRIRSPYPWDWRLFAHFGGGALFVGLLTFLRYRFGWDSLNPIGFCTATTFYHSAIWSGVFITWAIKIIIHKIGGLSLYRRCYPFFIGLVAGHVAGAIFCLAVDWIWFPGAGHDIRTMIYFFG